MVPHQSLDESKLIAALLFNVQTTHSAWFDKRALRLTINFVNRRVSLEGRGFLTKALPRLGRALDRALTGASRINATELCFSALPGSELPRFLGEFWMRVFSSTGMVLLDPCVESVRILRQILYLFYKYELDYSHDDEQKVLDQFIQTEKELCISDKWLMDILKPTVELAILHRSRVPKFRQVFQTLEGPTPDLVQIVRIARRLLLKLFERFDPTDIIPSHGPGVVSTKEQLWNKFRFTNVPDRVAQMYPLDEYFFVNKDHLCDRLSEIKSLTSSERPSKVILVPKDSRGPRLISCEPLCLQWIQQGLSRAIVQHVERNDSRPYASTAVRFTDQGCNRVAALSSSKTGRYATLDLKEASDRVSLELVRLLFPEWLMPYLEACRSLSTVMPSGETVVLRKFAPMGSALCFPIMALTIWSLLAAASPDSDSRDRILVYGDDVIVETAKAADAIELLEVFGLKINQTKSCTTGFFRESCGMDAFKGIDVTPVRIRTVWSSHRCPESYTSWISYANSLYDRKYYAAYSYIKSCLGAVYGTIPEQSMHLACPALRTVPDQLRPKISRTNRDLQKRQWKVWDLKPRKVHKTIDGWLMLLRYFTEGQKAHRLSHVHSELEKAETFQPFSVDSYTKRRASMLVRCWR
jgi:hypothetical protein